MQRSAKIYICDLCGIRADFDFDVGRISTEEKQWGSLDYLGEWINICPKCMTKLLNGQLNVIKDIRQILVGRGQKIE